MPKNSQKVVFKRIFFSENWSFFAFFVIICIKIVATFFLGELRMWNGWQWIKTCLGECLALVPHTQLYEKKRNGRNAPRVRKS